MEIDYYGILGIKKSSSELEIKQAYRRLILQYNPERQKDESLQELFVTLSEAYDCLSNPLYRAVYDQYGEGVKDGVLGPQGYIQPYVYHGDPIRTYREFFGTDSPYPDLLDAQRLCSTVCSLPEDTQVKPKEEPIIHPLFLTLQEVFYGGIKRHKIQRYEYRGNDHTTRELKEKILDIPITRGIVPGTKIIFKEEGDQDPAITSADIIFVIKDRPHPRFEREGTNIIMTCNVTLEEALIGCVIKVEMLDDRVLRIPITDIITPNYEYCTENEGMPDMANPNIRGNLILKFKIQFPSYLPKVSKLLIKKAMHLARIELDGDNAHQLNNLILANKMNHIAKDQRLPE